MLHEQPSHVQSTLRDASNEASSLLYELEQLDVLVNGADDFGDDLITYPNTANSEIWRRRLSRLLTMVCQGVAGIQERATQLHTMIDALHGSVRNAASRADTPVTARKVSAVSTLANRTAKKKRAKTSAARRVFRGKGGGAR